MGFKEKSKTLFLFLLVFTLLFSFQVSALEYNSGENETLKYNSDEEKNIYNEFYDGESNESDYWVTSEGNLDDASDILFSDLSSSNINISGYNVTADNFKGSIDSSNIQNEYWVNESGDTMTGDLTMNASNIYADKIKYTNPVSQYHRKAGIDTNTLNTWQNVTFDTIVKNETTFGYNLTDNNQSIQVNFSGIVKAQGKLTVINNATSSETQKIAFRILAGGVENTCTQVSSNTNRGSGRYNTEIITGTTRVEKGDKLILQYQVDDTDLDIQGDPVFDNPVAISLNFEKISE